MTTISDDQGIDLTVNQAGRDTVITIMTTGFDLFCLDRLAEQYLIHRNVAQHRLNEQFIELPRSKHLRPSRARWKITAIYVDVRRTPRPKTQALMHYETRPANHPRRCEQSANDSVSGSLTASDPNDTPKLSTCATYNTKRSFDRTIVARTAFDERVRHS